MLWSKSMRSHDRSVASVALGLLLAWATVLGVACGGSDERSTGDLPAGGRQAEGVVAVAGIPEEQRAFFLDGKVDVDEYRQAFAQFKECAAERGISDQLQEVGVDPVTGVISYQTSIESPLEAPGVTSGSQLNDCYQLWFAQTEIAFQTSDPNVVAALPGEQMKFFDSNIRPCLEMIGITVPADLQYNDENWGPLTETATRAIADGQC